MPCAPVCAMPCSTAYQARRLFILQSYVFLGAKPNYPAIFALNVRPAPVLRHIYRGTPNDDGKVFQRSVSIFFHNYLTFNALQKAMFQALKGHVLQAKRWHFAMRKVTF